MVVDAPPDEAKLSRLVAKWAVEARQPQLARRMKAFEELYELAREFGPRVSPAVDVLLEGLEDADLQIGESAVWALGYCLPDSLEPLAACLAHPAALVRERAAHALGNVGEDARPAATALRGLLIDTVQAVRSRAAWALGLLHDADPATASGLIAMLAHGTPGDQQSALHAIGNLGKASDSELDWSPHTELITAGLWSPAGGTRRCALYALEALDLDPAREAELLVRLLQCEQDSEVLQAALGRLESLAAVVDLSPHVRMITGLVPHGTRVARTVCEVLGVVRHGTPETIAVLIELLDDDDLVSAAARALWAIEGERAADCLLKALARMFESQPESACDVVCLLGPVAAPLIPRVVAALAEEHWDLQWAAADALGAIASGTPETLAALLQAMAHDSPLVRSAAAKALAGIGEAAVPALKVLAADPAADCRVGAVYALGMMGAAASSALPELREGMRIGRQPLSGCCAIAVAAIAADAAAVPFLVDVLNSDHPAAPREAAARALGAFGPAATSAIAALDSARLHEEHDVREAAEEALAQIRGLRH